MISYPTTFGPVTGQDIMVGRQEALTSWPQAKETERRIERGGVPLFFKVIEHLRSHQQSVRVPVSPPPHQYPSLSIFFNLTISEDVKRYLLLDLICTYPMTNCVKHLFMCLLVIYVCMYIYEYVCMNAYVYIFILSLERCLFKSVLVFK
jgi:hypothetical protein